MKAEYDMSKMKSRKNPYARKLNKQITLRLDRKSSTISFDSSKNDAPIW